MIGWKKETIVLETAYAVCGSCGCAGPTAIDEHDANVLALNDGWSSNEQSINGKPVTIFVCPDCLDD